MKTVLDIILNKNHIKLEDAQLTAKEAMLKEDPKCVCEKVEITNCLSGYVIKSQIDVYGTGKTEDLAWENAIYNYLEL